MNFQFSRTILTTLAGIFFWFNTFSQVVCPKSHISGFEKEHKIGDIFNGTTTTTISSKSKLYVTLKEDNIYIQSNFKPNKGFEYPIKLATPIQERYNKLDDYLANIYFFGDETAPEPNFATSFFSTLKKNVEIVVDPTVLNSSDFSNLGFENYSNLKIACPDNTAREVKILTDGLGKAKEFLIKSNNNISIRIKNQNINIVTSDIKNINRNPKKLKLISLVENRATKQLIEREFAENYLKIDYNKESLKTTLIETKGNLTVVLGHIENEKFVTIDKAGQILFEMELAELVDLQKKNSLQLLLIGCNSGINSGTGVLNKFNSIDFLSKLKFARETGNMEDFLNKICDNNFDFVIDETFFIEANEIVVSSGTEKQISRVDIEVYLKGKDNKIHNPSIGKIIFLNSNPNQINNTFQNDSTENNDKIGSQVGSSLKPNDSENEYNLTLYIILGIGALVVGYFIFNPKK